MPARRVAENVRRLRKERGLSQEEMAELANFHRTYVSQLERCVTNISVGGLEKLAQALERRHPGLAGQDCSRSERATAADFLILRCYKR